MIKVIFSFLLLFLFACEGADFDNRKSRERYEFVGTYYGLTDNYEFEFEDEYGNMFLMQELGNFIFYDLYEEIYSGGKFQVFWEERVVKEKIKSSSLEQPPKKIKVIVGLKML